MNENRDEIVGTFGIKLSPTEYAATRLRRRHGHVRGPAPTAACWTDLLGFSQQLAGSDWRLDSANMVVPVSRLIQLSQETSGRTHPFEEAVFVNDAVIRTCHPETYTASLSERHNFLTWLESCIVAHCNVTGLEQDYSLPGLRTIVCEGQMVTYADPVSPEPDPILSGWVHHLSTLQLNTALSKCYLADSLGSKIGLKRGGLYIEDTIIHTLVERFACTFYGPDALFLYGFPILSPVEAYVGRKDLVWISERRTRSLAPFKDRSCWMLLGGATSVNKGGLSFNLRELLAFSPSDEFALMWYDTFRGDMHGYQISDAIPVRADGEPLYPELQVAQLQSDKTIRAYLDAYDRYSRTYPNLPWEGRPHMQERGFMIDPDALV